MLPLEFNDFMPGYFGSLQTFFAADFADGALADLIIKSTNAMVNNDGSRSNADAFWEDFAIRLKRTRTELEPRFEAFYRDEFGLLGKGVGLWPEASDVVIAARKAGAKVVCATNPVFPLVAVEHRLGWAGVSPVSFDLITDYENMSFAKPNPGYYRQIAQMIGVEPRDCLMVGNDVALDLDPARQAGMSTYMVNSPYSVNADGFAPDYEGALKDLSRLLSQPA